VLQRQGADSQNAEYTVCRFGSSTVKYPYSENLFACLQPKITAVKPAATRDKVGTKLSAERFFYPADEATLKMICCGARACGLSGVFGSQ
jgi:hypothetical protein